MAETHAFTHVVGTPGPEAKKNRISIKKKDFPQKIRCFSWELYTYMSLKFNEACNLQSTPGDTLLCTHFIL